MVKYPLKFVPQTRTAVWGREMWLVSGYPSMPSVVANGPYAGRTLPSLAEEFGADFMGEKVSMDDRRFPLLVKIIEADDRLSLQVHPNETAEKLYGGNSKTEMWYVLDGKTDAGVFAGIRPGVTENALRDAIRDGTAEDKIFRLPAVKDTVFFIPGGLVHSIGAGCRLYEVQQTSDTTWRLYDWNRKDPKTGKGRPLNEREGMACIDWSLPPPAVRYASDDESLQTLVSCEHFRFSCLSIADAAEPVEFPADTGSFRILHVSEGACAVFVEGASPIDVSEDECVLVPAGVSYAVAAKRPSRVLLSERGHLTLGANVT